MNNSLIPKHSLIAGMAALGLLMTSCTENTQSPGLEYMPDMYRGPAIEAYVDYGQDPYHYTEELAAEQRMRPSARVPVEGTIPFNQDASRVMYNMPYNYPNSNEGYDAAGAQLKSPIPITQATVADGEILYNKFCVHCHGGSGKGDGPVVSVGGHPPPLAYDGPLKDRTEGHIFHVVTYGKGMMGPHAPLMTKEERWLVTHYVKYLQNGGNLPGVTPAGGQTGGAATGGNAAVAADTTGNAQGGRN